MQQCNAVGHSDQDNESHEDWEPQIDTDIDAELENLIAECNDQFASQLSSQSSKTWSARMAELNTTWEEYRSQMFEIMVGLEFIPEDSPCSLCSTQPAIIRCHQCGDNQLLCYECDRASHSCKPFHDRQAWFEKHFGPIPSSEAIDEAGQIIEVDCYISFPAMKKTCCGCGTISTFHSFPKTEMTTVFTSQGRFEVNTTTFKCSNCLYSSPLTLADVLQNGYWPASPSSLTTLFAQDLFLLWDTLQKRMPGCSETSFVRSLEDLSLANGRIGRINPRTFTKAFREWKYCKYELDRVQSKEWLKCPTCTFGQHSCHVDGNMKLYRYKRSGSKQGESYYGDIFVASNNDVDNHLEKIYTHAHIQTFTDNGKCGETNWRAAGNKSKRRCHLDETGLEIAGCRHGLAQWAVNMFQGEIYGYANFIHINKMIPNSVEFMWEDIICKYWKWAENIPNHNLQQESIKPALSVMHAKAHNWSCQVLWGGRWQEGAACSTGEEVEQINSYLSRLCNTTKYMLPESREELITEYAIAWNKRKIVSLAEALCKRYAKTIKALDSTTVELDEMLGGINMVRNDVDAVQWKNDVQSVAKELESHSSSSVSDEEELFLLNTELNSRTCQLPTLVKTTGGTLEKEYFNVLSKKAIGKYATMEEKRKRVEILTRKLGSETSVRKDILDKGQDLFLRRALKVIQNELEMLSFGMYQRKTSINKLAASSKMRAKLRKKMSVDQTKINKRIELHNAVQFALYGEEMMPLDESCMVDEMFPWTINDLSMRLKCKIVDKFEIMKRHEEELALVKKEMIQYLKFYKDSIIPQLKSEIKGLEDYVKREITSSHVESRTTSCDLNNKEIRYVTAVNKPKKIVMGEISLRWKGVDFAKQQLNLGITKFSRVHTGDFTMFLANDGDDDELLNEGSIYDSEEETINDDIIDQILESQNDDLIVNWTEDDCENIDETERTNESDNVS